MSTATPSDHRHAIPPDVVEQTLRRRRRWRRAVLVHRVADALALAVAASLALVSEPQAGDAEAWAWALGYGLVVICILQVRGFYRSQLSASALETVARIVAASSIAAMVFLAVQSLWMGTDLTSALIVRLWFFSSTLLSAQRLGVELDARIVRAASVGTATLIVGSGRVGRVLAQRLLERPQLGLTPIGFLDDDPLKTDEELPVLGTTSDLTRVVVEHNVAHVIVSFSRAPHDVILHLMRQCRKLGVEVAAVPRFFEEVSSRVTVQHLGGISLLQADHPDPAGWQFKLKHVIDRTVAVLAILVLSPLLAALALAVKRSSPGPVLYRQPRIGRDGREFAMLKFRSMRGDATTHGQADADWAARQLGVVADGAEAPPAVDRRTAVGRFLRRTSLDELPQLLNVLRGDMSLVGPRPERTSYVRAFEQDVYRYGDRHRVKSGLTGWAQVHGFRGDTSLSDRVEWDNWYIENFSLGLDFKILLMTIPALIRGSS